MGMRGEATGKSGCKIETAVTCGEDEQVGVDGGTADVVPARRFLLNLPYSTKHELQQSASLKI